MHPRIEEALNYLDEQRNALYEAVELVPPALREKSPAADGWSVAQVLQHLAMIDNLITRVVNKVVAKARAEEVGPELETTSILNSLSVERVADRSRRVPTPEEIRPPADVHAKSALAALGQSRAGLRSAVLAGDGLAFTKVEHHHPLLGPLNLYQWLLFLGSHEARHTAQLREIATGLRADSGTAAGALRPLELRVATKRPVR